MTLLSIAQEILQQTKSATIPSTIIGNNQPVAIVDPNFVILLIISDEGDIGVS